MCNKLLVLFACIFISFTEAKSDVFEVWANNVNTKKNITTANGNVTIFSKSYYITADKMLFDHKKRTFELFGNVVIMKENKLFTKSHYSFLDMQNDKLFQEPTFLLDVDSKVWINSNTSKKNKNITSLGASVISSCDCDNPDWTFRVKNSQYNSDKKWIDIYNTTVYIKDVPVFYTPYFGFSTDTTRRTGLLLPTVGYSDNDGLIYTQPIFFALDDSYDLELSPGIRTNRAYRLHAIFRLIDSEYSRLNIESGVFVETGKYHIENNLKNKNHFGYNIKYESTKLFSSNENKDGLLASFNWLNDIDYASLMEDKNKNKKIKSFLTYYYDTPEYYFGTYFKYYLDTSSDSNNESLQELPEVQLHSYSKNIILDKLLYSSNVLFSNYTREEGIVANKTEINLPISYIFTMFDDYINLTLKEELRLVKLNYFNHSSSHKNATFVELNHYLGLSSNLIKSYSNHFHTMNFNAKLLMPTIIKENGDLYNINTQAKEMEVFKVDNNAESISLSLNHSFYKQNTFEQVFNHKIVQSLIHNKNSLKLENLENDVSLRYSVFEIKNRSIYSNIDKKIVESSSSLNLGYMNYKFGLDYFISKETPNSPREDLESYNINTSVGFYEDYTLSYYENNNITKNIKSKQGIALNIDDKCWGVNIALKKEIEPSSNIKNKVISQNIFYIALTLKPFAQWSFGEK